MKSDWRFLASAFFIAFVFTIILAAFAMNQEEADRTKERKEHYYPCTDRGGIPVERLDGYGIACIDPEALR